MTAWRHRKARGGLVDLGGRVKVPVRGDGVFEAPDALDGDLEQAGHERLARVPKYKEQPRDEGLQAKRPQDVELERLREVRRQQSGAKRASQAEKERLQESIRRGLTAKAPDPPGPPSDLVVAMTEHLASKCSHKNLTEACRTRSLPLAGSKTDLAARLVEYVGDDEDRGAQLEADLGLKASTEEE